MFRSRIAAAALLAVGSATAFATTPVAHVYVQTTKGVNLYNAASNGALSLAAGSPFKTIGLMVGTNGKFFFSNGTNLIHVYAMNTSTGAIGKEVANIDSSLYSGSECGTTGPTFLDHTGQYLYLEHDNAIDPNGGSLVCYSIQSFKVNTTTGQLTYLGSAGDDLARLSGPPGGFTLSANNLFAYAIHDPGYGSPLLTGFKRQSAGDMFPIGFNEKDAPPYDSSYSWLQFAVAADPANHLATVAMQEQGIPMGAYTKPFLASYTFDTQGNIATTNTWQTMAKPVIWPTSLNMSPSGKLLAVAGNINNPASQFNPTMLPGLQVFHFNGAAPITKYSGALTSDNIDFIHWDNANHLYALSNSSGKLYVYTVTPTAITSVPGSPFKVPYLSKQSSLTVR
jgi:hypothetical protein